MFDQLIKSARDIFGEPLGTIIGALCVALLVAVVRYIDKRYQTRKRKMQEDQKRIAMESESYLCPEETEKRLSDIARIAEEMN